VLQYLLSYQLCSSGMTSGSIIRPFSHHCWTHLICKALVPRTRARSYLVMYGVVLRSSVGIFFSRTPMTAFFFPPAVPDWLGSLMATILLPFPLVILEFASFGSWPLVAL
jgi:hypothetical protein